MPFLYSPKNSIISNFCIRCHSNDLLVVTQIPALFKCEAKSGFLKHKAFPSISSTSDALLDICQVVFCVAHA